MSTATNQRYKFVIMPSPALHIWGDGTLSNFYDYACTWKGCVGQQVIAKIAYDYITGRKGRWSYAEKYVCQKHLDQWLKKNPNAKEIKDLHWGKL